MMLEFKQVNTFYGRVQALHDVSLSVRKGELLRSLVPMARASLRC